MSEKFSYLEPAERPLKVDLSRAEVAALTNYHISECKRITRVVGKKLMSQLPGQFFPPGARYAKTMIQFGRDQIKNHTARAKGLNKLLK